MKINDKLVSYFIQILGSLFFICLLFVIAKTNSTDFFGEFSARYAVFFISYNLVDYGLSVIGPRIYREMIHENFFEINLLFIQIILSIIGGFLFFISSLFFNKSYIILEPMLCGFIMAFTPLWILASNGALVTASLLSQVSKVFLLLIIIIFTSFHQNELKIIFLDYLIFLLIMMVLIYFFIFCIRNMKFSKRLSLSYLYQNTKHYYLQHIIGFFSGNIGQYIIFSYNGTFATANYSIAEKIARPISMILAPFRNIIIAKNTSKNNIFFESILIIISLLFLILFSICFKHVSSASFFEKFNVNDIYFLVILLFFNNLILSLIEINITLKVYNHSKEKVLTSFSVFLNLFSLILIYISIIYFDYFWMVFAMIFTNLIFLIFLKNKF